MQVGIGLRQPHYAELLAAPPPMGFVEVHSENFFADGGAALAVLREARCHYPVSLHGVGLALGSAAGLDPWHLDRLDRLVQRIDPVRVSDHACFARAAPAPGQPVVHAGDLLPIAFNDATLELMVRHVGQVQERLRRPILVENLSSYLSFEDDSMSEPEFFARLCRRSGCGMLLDVNNLMVNALNTGDFDGVDIGVVMKRGGAPEAGTDLRIVAALRACVAYVDALPPGIVGEMHLAGYGEAGSLVIDDHGSRVRPSVWTLYGHALGRFGALPTLVEWDTELPPLGVLLGEAARAAELQRQHAAAA